MWLSNTHTSPGYLIQAIVIVRAPTRAAKLPPPRLLPWRATKFHRHEENPPTILFSSCSLYKFRFRFWGSSLCTKPARGPRKNKRVSQRTGATFRGRMLQQRKHLLRFRQADVPTISIDSNSHFSSANESVLINPILFPPTGIF